MDADNELVKKQSYLRKEVLEKGFSPEDFLMFLEQQGEGKTDLEDKEKHTFLRTMFPSLLITGPFSIVLGFNGGLMALNDRLKLRSMVVGEKDDKVYIASEEAAIRAMDPDAGNFYAPSGGEPVIVKVKEGVEL